MSNSKVSIIITNYNYAGFIEGAIKSALRQTHTNIELIVIDDGSTDRTIDVLQNYKNDKRVKIISRENKGVIYTRNEGVKLSTGDFIIQLDADDTLELTYVEECLKKAENGSLDIVYTQTHTFGRVDYISKHPEFDLETLKHHGYIHAASLVRKSKLGKDPYDIYLDKLGNEDWDLFLDLCLDGASAGLIDKPLLNYRKHTDRHSRADDFEGLYKESLVRHHIWSKQNAKHPDQFWYFSTQIDTLLEFIGMYKDNQELKQACKNKDSLLQERKLRIEKLEKRDLVTIFKKIKNKIAN